MSNPINKPCKYHTARRRFVWRVDSTSSEAPVPTRQFYSTNLFTILFFRQPVLLCNYLLLFSLPNGISPDFFFRAGGTPLCPPPTLMTPLWTSDSAAIYSSLFRLWYLEWFLATPAIRWRSWSLSNRIRFLAAGTVSFKSSTWSGSGQWGCRVK